jgi:acetone carboxylase gamma subunit
LRTIYAFEIKMKIKLKHIQQEIISDFQLQRDQAAYDLLKMKEQFELQRKLNILNDFVDFNAAIVLPRLMPLFINMAAIDFLIKNHNQIKRKFSIGELIEYGKMYRITTRFSGQINSLSDLKKKYNNIKPVSYTQKANIY